MSEQSEGWTVRRRRRGAPGGRPGVLQVDPTAAPSDVQVIGYGPEDLEERHTTDPEEIRELRSRHPVTWVNVDGLGDVETVGRIGELFEIHPLALEDVVNVPQRPKVDAYGEHLFIVVQMISRQQYSDIEQLGIFLGPSSVVTFQERSGDPLGPVRERLRAGRSRIRSSGSDYLAYALIDAVIDHYFPAMENFQEDLIRLEDDLREPSPDALDRIQHARNEVRELHRVVRPLREMTRSLAGGEWPRIADETRVYLRDCHDHAIEATELVDSCREISSSLMDIHLSTMSHQANTTMKVLTIIATIFMPLSFIAGLYGMNFNPDLPGNMPELDLPYGYVGALGAMAAIGLGLVVYFRRKGWF